MKMIIKQGDTLRRKVKLTYRATGAPVSLTGCTAFAELRAFPGQELLATGTTAITASTGTVTVTFSKDQINALLPGEYGYDIRLEKDTDRKTIYTERFTLVKPYTERSN